MRPITLGMGRKLCELSLTDLAVATVATEIRVGVDGTEAKAFRAEVSRRALTDKGVDAYFARARRFAAAIAEGCTIDTFSTFSRADRELAVALGAKRKSFIQFSHAGFKLNLGQALKSGRPSKK